VTAALAGRLGIRTRLLPMSDKPVRTRVRTPAGWLDFQDYFVRQRCEPVLQEIRYEGAGTSPPSSAVLEALTGPHLRGIVICPSNPLLSVGPILAIPAIREALSSRRAPAVAVSPIVGGAAVRGPTAKIMRELGGASTAADVARGYAALIDAFLVDPADTAGDFPPGVRVVEAPGLMTTLEDRKCLARAALAAVDAVARGNPGA
jgi:LPPG:FO 2-phospho-L-lactate transferase